MEIEQTMKYIEERSEDLAKYSNKLREAVKDIDGVLTPMFERAGLGFTDVKGFDEEWNEAVGTVKSYLGVGKTGRDTMWGILVIQETGDGDKIEKFLIDASRNNLKEAVKRIPAFLDEYSKVLAEREKEFLEISTAAEAMAAALRGGEEEA